MPLQFMTKKTDTSQMLMFSNTLPCLGAILFLREYFNISGLSEMWSWVRFNTLSM